METLARYCVFCGKEIPGAAERKARGPRASCCPSCNTIDIYQYFKPCERARLRIAAGKGMPAAPAAGAPRCVPAGELLPVDGMDTRHEDAPADANIDVATLLPFRMGASARETPAAAAPADAGAAPEGSAPASGGAADAPREAAGREDAAASYEADGTMGLPQSDSGDQYVTMQIKRTFDARLTLVAGGAEPAEIALREGALVVGGVKACDVVVNTPQLTISRRHALLRCSRGEGGRLEVSVEDLKSRNGTLVNGVKITAETRLKPGDEVTFADATYRFER